MDQKTRLANTAINLIGWICNETTSTGLYKVHVDRLGWPFLAHTDIPMTESDEYIYFQLDEIEIEVDIWTKVMFGYVLHRCTWKILPKHYFILDQIADDLDILRTHNNPQITDQPKLGPKLLCRRII